MPTASANYSSATGCLKIAVSFGSASLAACNTSSCVIILSSSRNTNIGNNANSKHGQPHMHRNDHFLNGAHTNGIATKAMNQFVFSPCFKCWASNAIIYSFLHLYLQMTMLSFLAFFTISFGIRARSYPGTVVPVAEWFFPNNGFTDAETYVIGNDHQVAHFECRVNSTCGIR